MIKKKRYIIYGIDLNQIYKDQILIHRAVDRKVKLKSKNGTYRYFDTIKGHFDTI